MVVARVIGKLSEGPIFLLFLPLRWTDPRLQLSSHTWDHYAFYVSGAAGTGEPETAEAGAGGSFRARVGGATLVGGKEPSQSHRGRGCPPDSPGQGTTAQG